MQKRCSSSAALAFVFLAAVLLRPAAAQVPDQLPAPDGKPADQSKPVKVYILLGQSNMLGFGKVGPADALGTLEYMVKEKGYHYFHNAETYMEVGQALGRAMAELEGHQ
ncbi:MAG TPA: hypothetical protein VMM76_11995 [Pirellulaceae bacterium]|nr:hypothetical protein [Pirellulaceae bacterium]